MVREILLSFLRKKFSVVSMIVHWSNEVSFNLIVFCILTVTSDQIIILVLKKKRRNLAIMDSG